MKVTVTFHETSATFNLDDVTEEEFLKDPYGYLDVHVSDMEPEWDWEVEDENA